MSEFINVYLFIRGASLAVSLLMSALHSSIGDRDQARVLAIAGLIGPIPLIVFYYYLTFAGKTLKDLMK